jgi:DNA-binding transcriptional ArsR family regulator
VGAETLDIAIRSRYFPYWFIIQIGKHGSPMAAVIDEDRLSETFAALASATRRAILARLAEGAATVNELAQPFDLTLPAVSKHIKVLEQAGLVVRGRSAQYRPCALEPSPLRDVSTWAEQYRPVWEARFDRLAAYVAELDANRKDER